MDLMEEEDVSISISISIPDPDLEMESISSSVYSLTGGTDDAPSTTSSSSNTFCDMLSGDSVDVLDGECTASVAVGVLAGECTTVSRMKCVGNNSRVSWGSATVIGRRQEMEDEIAVIPGFMMRSCDHVGGCTAQGSRSSNEILPVHFFGVYDGHGGAQVAKYCAKRMHDIVREEWERESVFDGNEWRKKWESALCSGFAKADNDVLVQCLASEMVGSTAVVVLLSACQIIASNCGDSRAILCQGNQTLPLTVDHKPDREDELIRIEKEGGKVINWNGSRVFGVLAMSRSIGDHYLRPWIIPSPEISFTTRTDEDECLIIASDGLWDVMSNDEVGEFARRFLRRRRRFLSGDEIVSPPQALADHLADIAFARNSTDNVSIIVVDLKSRRRFPLKKNE